MSLFERLNTSSFRITLPVFKLRENNRSARDWLLFSLGIIICDWASSPFLTHSLTHSRYLLFFWQANRVTPWIESASRKVPPSRPWWALCAPLPLSMGKAFHFSFFFHFFFSTKVERKVYPQIWFPSVRCCKAILGIYLSIYLFYSILLW